MQNLGIIPDMISAKGMFIPYYGNQEFFPFANGVNLKVIIMKNPLHNCNTIITDWKQTESRLEVDWKQTGSRLERDWSGLEADWKQTGSGLKADWK